MPFERRDRGATVRVCVRPKQVRPKQVMGRKQNPEDKSVHPKHQMLRKEERNLPGFVAGGGVHGVAAAASAAWRPPSHYRWKGVSFHTQSIR
jgi:hypothetical protein